MRRAAIVLGTNSTRLLLAEVRDSIRPVLLESRVTRLGQGVDQQGRLTDEAVNRVMAALTEFRELIEPGIPVRIGATSAVRDAANRRELAEKIRERFGWELSVISGTEEARLSFAGMLAAFSHLQSPLVVDLGGGSTEFMGKNYGPVSLNIGAVRLTERFFRSDPPSLAEQQKLVNFVKKELAVLPPVSGPCELVAVGGTANNLVSIADSLPEYDWRRVHGRELSLAQIRQLSQQLLTLPLAFRRQITGIQPGREDILPAGALILYTIGLHFGVDRFLVSVADLLWAMVRGETH